MRIREAARARCVAAKGAKRNGGFSNPRSEDLFPPDARSPVYDRPFPARMSREQTAKSRRHFDKLIPQTLSRRCPGTVPCIYRSDRDVTRRDRFASDCQHHQILHGSALGCHSEKVAGIWPDMPTALGHGLGSFETMRSDRPRASASGRDMRRSRRPDRFGLDKRWRARLRPLAPCGRAGIGRWRPAPTPTHLRTACTPGPDPIDPRITPGQDIGAWRSGLSGVGHGSRARDRGVRTGASPIPRAP